MGSVGEIQEWDSQTGVFIRTLFKSARPIQLYAISPDGKKLATAYPNDPIFQIWDIETGSLLQTCAGHEASLDSLQFSPDGSILFSGGSDYTARIWDTSTGRVLSVIDRKNEYTRFKYVSFSPDGKQIATCGYRNEILFIDIASGQIEKILQRRVNVVKSVDYLPNGITILITDDTNVATILNPKTEFVVKTIGEGTGTFYTAALSPDGKKVILLYYDRIFVYHAASGQFLYQIENDNHLLNKMCMSPNGSRLAAAGTKVLLWDVKAENSNPILEINKFCRGIQSVFFTADGKKVLAGTIDRVIERWNLMDTAPEHSVTADVPNGELIKIAGNGSKVMIGRKGNDSELWDIDKEKKVLTFPFTPDGSTTASCYAISADGSFLVTEKFSRLW